MQGRRQPVGAGSGGFACPHRRRRALCAALAIGLAASALPAAAVATPAPGPDDDLVELEAAAPVPARDLAPVTADKLVAAPRARFVDLDVDALLAQLAEPEVRIELFPDVVVPLRSDGPVADGVLGTRTWSGSSPDGYATLTFAAGGVRGDIAHDGVRYDLAPAGDDGRHLVTIEARDFPDEIEAHVPDSERTAADMGALATPDIHDGGRVAGSASSAADGATIRVLVWFDTNARNKFGGTNQLAQDEIAATINETNEAYQRSGITQAIDSVGIEHVSYAAAIGANTQLNRLTDPTDGQLDAIHARRDEVGADLVALVSELSDACGIGWLSTSVSDGDEYGFSVTDPDCARGNLSFAHELGHNMGAGHGGGNGGGTYSYSNGYLDAAHGFRTIMAYDSGGCCTRVAHFSSPTRLYNGWATGDASHDNARTLNTTAATVAAYRDDPVPSPANDAFASATAWVPAMGNPVTGTNAGATKEAGEPAHAGVSGGKSVWWKYTPAVPQLVNVSTAGSGFDTLLAVYTGGSVGGLTQIAANDDAAANTTRSKLDFLASAGVTYYFAVDGYAGASGVVAMTITVADPGGDWFTPLSPARIQDSRPAGPKVGPYATPWGTGTARTVQATGVGGVPSGARAVTLNVTVTNASASSYLTLWPTGQSRPLASNLNWTPGRTVANAVTVKVGSAGKVSVFNAAGNVDVIIDVVGYYDEDAGEGAGFTSLSPARIQDSRPAGPKVGPYATPWGTGTARTVQADEVGGVPKGAEAVVLNVTVTNASASSYLTLWPTGQSRPLASSLNWTPGRTVANAVTVKVGSAGRISVFNALGAVDVIIDVVGYFTAESGAAFHPAAPVRIQDSRPGGPKVGPYGTPWGPATARTVQTGSVAGVPGNAAAALLNVTVTNGTSSSFLTVWPTGQTRPLASSLNWNPGNTVPNAVTVKLGSTGRVSYYNAAGSVDVIADVAGWYG